MITVPAARPKATNNVPATQPNPMTNVPANQLVNACDKPRTWNLVIGSSHVRRMVQVRGIRGGTIKDHSAHIFQ